MRTNPGPDDEPAPPASTSVDRHALGIGFASVIVELAPDGILVTDDHGRILMANRHIEELFGHDRDALVGIPIESLLPPRLRRVHETHRAHYATAPTLRRMGSGLDLSGCHADGSEFPVEISLSPVATEFGAATVVIIRDVTHERALELDVQAAMACKPSDRIAADIHDNVVGHLSRSALTITSALRRNQLDERTTVELHDVIDELDNAIREIRTAIFTTLTADRDPNPTGPHRRAPIPDRGDGPGR